MRVEGIGYLKIVGDEALQGLTTDVSCSGERPADCYVGATVIRGGSALVNIVIGQPARMEGCIRGEVAALAGQDRDIDIIALGNFTHYT